MKLDLTPEQAFFAGTTRQFLDDKVPTSLLRGDPAGFGRDFWRQGADLGWTSLLVPEADGGGSVSVSGTIEMSRNGVSERLLGMPREARRDNDIAFRDVPRSAPSR